MKTGKILVAKNPIIPFRLFQNPDIVRVCGNTYYMASTTMHFMPGCVEFYVHTNLVKWENTFTCV